MAGSELVELKLEDITYGSNQTRLEIDDSKVQDLAASIRRVGLINPIVVAPDGDKYVIIAGHHRYRAVELVGRGSIRCLVRSAEGTQVKEVAIADNLFRTDLSPIETASALKDMLDSGTMDPAELAKAMHRSVDWVWRQISLLNWPPDVLEVVHGGEISVSAASNLALIEDETYRAFLLRNAVDSGATARATAAWLQAWRAAKPADEAIQAEPVGGREPVLPALPQAPCLVCNTLSRTDALAYVLICPGCIAQISGAANSP